MKSKTLLVLALLTIPLIHAADPKAATGPRLIKEFVVDELNSVGFACGRQESIQMVLAYKLDGKTYVTRGKLTPYESVGIDEAEYSLDNISAGYIRLADHPSMVVVGTTRNAPNVLSIFKLDNQSENALCIPIEFEHPIRSFTFSKDCSFIYVTLENDTTFRVECNQSHFEPSELQLPEHGGILHVEGVYNPRYIENCIVASSIHPHCPQYFHTSGEHGIFYNDNCQDPKYTSDLPPLPHCLCDVANNTWALIRCVLPDTLCVYKTQGEKEFGIFLDHLTYRPSCLALNTCGDVLVIGYTNGVIEIRDIEDHAWTAEFYLELPDEEAQHHYQITTLALSPLRSYWKSKILIHGTMPIYLVVAYMKDDDASEQVLILDIGPMLSDTIKRARPAKPQGKTKQEVGGSLASCN